MARNQRNRRQFEWARAAGFGQGVVLPDTPAAVGGVDLLASVRGDYGAAYLRGATVMAIKGYIRPFAGASTRILGVAGIRVCNIADLQTVTLDQTPGGPLGGEADWMAYWPYDFEVPGGSQGSTEQVANWNPQASLWGVDVQSSRRMEEAGVTLGLFWEHSALAGGDPSGVTNLDYHLSVGLKLA